MSVPHALLALLSEGPKYGLRLQSEFEARTGEVWPLNVGQVYTTLQRLERDGLVETDARRRAVAEALSDHRGRRRGAHRLASHAARPRPAAARRARDQGPGRAAGSRHRHPRAPASAPPARDRGHAALHPHQGGGRTRAMCALALVADAELFRLEAIVRWLDAADVRLKRLSSPPAAGGRPVSPISSRGGGFAMTSALELRRVSKVYGSGPSEVHALRDVDLVVERGELVAVMGPSGSGKSTLLTIAGSLEEASSGEVLVDGVDLASISRADRATMRRRSIGYVFQDFNLLPGLTAVENVTLPLELDGVRAKAARATGLSALEELDVVDRADRYPDELSGGERQRVAIARAIVGERGSAARRRADRRARLRQRRRCHAPAARGHAARSRGRRGHPRGAAGVMGRPRRLPARRARRRPDGSRLPARTRCSRPVPGRDDARPPRPRWAGRGPAASPRGAR